MKKLTLSLVFFLLAHFVSAQFNRHVIQFTDKGSNTHALNNPQTFLSQRSIDRRVRHAITIDSTDLPVTQRYIDSIVSVSGVTLLAQSRWLNSVAILITDQSALTEIQAFPFVANTNPIAARGQGNIKKKKLNLNIPTLRTAGRNHATQNDFYDYGSSADMVQIHQGNFLHNLGFRGQTMQIAFSDAGYYRYQNIPTFDSAILNNRIIETWDFVKRETSVNEDHVHGMQCFSTVAANIPGVFVGTAPQASYYLYRTEDAGTEYPIELFYLASSYERADSAGADVVSTSLGYTTYSNSIFDHTYADMDGNTTIGAIAADIAAKKGLLMVIAAGNEGSGAWRFITTPADADSVLSVGAVNALGESAPFSSYGPSSDGQIKPTLAAVGWGAMIANHFTGEPYPSNGTSFAAPNLAGIATCLWQAFPEVNNMQIIQALIESGSTFSTPDDRIGYGIPDAKHAFVNLLKKGYIQNITLSRCATTLQLRVKQATGMTVTVERKVEGAADYTLIHNFQGNGAFEFTDLNFTDVITALPEGTIQYRIGMQIGTDTTFYLDSTSLQHHTLCNPVKNEIRVSPNPINEQINLELIFIESGKLTLALYNAAGQSIHKSSSEILSGRTRKSIASHHLSAGLYFLKVFLNDKLIHIVRIVR